MKIINWFGGRKSIFAIFLFLIVTIFLLCSKCNFDQWANFCIWIFGTYSVGNGVELLTKIKKPKNE